MLGKIVQKELKTKMFIDVQVGQADKSPYSAYTLFLTLAIILYDI